MAENLFSPEGLQEILTKIIEIDGQLAAASGSEAQQRKAAIERIASENSDEINKTVTKLVEAVAKLQPGVIAGVLDRFEEAASEKFQGVVDELITAELAKVTNEGGVNPDTLKSTRKELVADFDSLKRLLAKALPEGSEAQAGVVALEVPRSRRGSGAGSGKSKSGKNKEGYRYAIDGKDRPNSQNTLSAVTYYATEKCPTPDGRERWTTEEFRNFLSEQGVKLGEDESFTVNLPNGKVVSGVKEAFDDADEADDETTPDNEPVAATA